MSGQSVANWTTNKSTLDSGSPFAVQDNAANIQTALSSLALDFHINQIILQDGPAAEIKITVSQITAAATALAILKNLNGTTASVIVSDTAASIGSNFAAIATDSQVSSIQISNSLAVTLTALQVGSNLAAIAKLVNADTSAAAVIVKDTAANLMTYLDRIETVAATVSQIVVSNNSQLTLTAAQVANDAAALATVRFNNGTTTNLFKVSDTAANIGANLGALATNMKITAIAVSDSAAVQTNVAEIASYAVALAKLANASGGGYSLTVTDNASNLSAALDALAASSHVTQMVIGDSASLTASVAQVVNDAGLLAATTNQGGGAYRLVVIDTATNIAGALQALGGNIHVGVIEVSSGTVMLSSVAALATDAMGLSKLEASDGITPASVIVTDTAANISTALDSLRITPSILKLVASDSASNQIVCTVHQLQLDSSVLGKIYDVDGSTTASVTISDTGANLSFAALATTASNVQVQPHCRH